MAKSELALFIQLGISEAWLAGLIDGEGCLTISISIQHEHSLHISPRFSISMKEGDWAIKVSAILMSHGIPFHIRKRRNQLEVTVSSGAAVRKLSSMLLPYLIVKRPLADRMASFPVANPRNRFTWVQDSYLNEICELVDFVRAFNKSKNRGHKWDGEKIKSFFKG